MYGHHPRSDTRKKIPNPMRIYGPIADLDFMPFSLQHKFMQDNSTPQILSKWFRNTTRILEDVKRGVSSETTSHLRERK